MPSWNQGAGLALPVSQDGGGLHRRVAMVLGQAAVLLRYYC
jgi:hypothetical protein